MNNGRRKSRGWPPISRWYIELEIATVHYRTNILKHEVAAKLQ